MLYIICNICVYLFIYPSNYLSNKIKRQQAICLICTRSLPGAEVSFITLYSKSLYDKI